MKLNDLTLDYTTSLNYAASLRGIRGRLVVSEGGEIIAMARPEGSK